MGSQYPFPRLPILLEGKKSLYLIPREENKKNKQGFMGVVYRAFALEERFSIPLPENFQGDYIEIMIRNYFQKNDLSLPEETEIPKIPGFIFDAKANKKYYLLAKGENTFVYEIQQSAPLALKTLLHLHDPTPEEEQEWKKAVRIFREEIQTLKRLSGIPGIIEVIDAGDEKKIPWYVMEYIEGPSITDGLKDKSLREKIQVLRSLVHSLAGAHERGVVHRDLKGPNILLKNGNECVILDFGISRIVDMARSNPFTKLTALFGTPRYMSPEQIEAVEKNSPQIDIWSLGVMFYEILVGVHPLGVEPSDTIPQIIHKIRHNEVIHLNELNPQIDFAIAEICLKALSRDLTFRYQNATEMARDLNGWESTQFEASMHQAEEFFEYGLWQNAISSVIQAHAWFPNDPRIRTFLTKIFTAREGKPMTIIWTKEITPAMRQFADMRVAFPPCIEAIRELHTTEPSFLVVPSPRGRRLKDFLSERKQSIGLGILDVAEAVRLTEMLAKAAFFLEQNHLPPVGVHVDNLYCEAKSIESIESFTFWGLGWQGQSFVSFSEAIASILRSCLTDARIPVLPGVESLLAQLPPAPVILDFLEGRLQEEESSHPTDEEEKWN